MQCKVLSVAALVLMTSGAIPAQAPIRYRVEIKNESTQDNAGLGAGQGLDAVITNKMQTIAFFSVTQRDSAGGRLVRVRFDSGQQSLDGSTVDLGKGGEVLLLLSPGKRARLSGSAMSEQVESVTNEMLRLLPSVPKGVVPGGSWADTVRSDTTRKDAGEVKTEQRQDVTVWTQSAADSITGKTESLMTGTFQETGAAIGTMKVTMTAEVAVALDPAGMTRSARSTGKYAFDVVIPGMGTIKSQGVIGIEVRRVE